ncbi:SRPBCC family protein [Naumannella huperziae]
MTTDANEQRMVEHIDRDGTPATRVVVTRHYRTDVADLWQALTDAERLPRWFLPVTGDLAVGGRYQLDGNAGGEVLSCDPPRHLAITWEMGGGPSWVDVTLSPDADGTVLELVHEAPVAPEFWETYGPGATGIGWDLALHRGLAEHLRTGAAVDRAEGEAWPTTPEGRAFVIEAANAWVDAAIAAGDEPAGARAAGVRCIAFYTGEGGDGERSGE